MYVCVCVFHKCTVLECEYGMGGVIQLCIRFVNNQMNMNSMDIGAFALCVSVLSVCLCVCLNTCLQRLRGTIGFFFKFFTLQTKNNLYYSIFLLVNIFFFAFRSEIYLQQTKQNTKTHIHNFLLQKKKFEFLSFLQLYRSPDGFLSSQKKIKTIYKTKYKI